jgi:hypothetical protein
MPEQRRQLIEEAKSLGGQVGELTDEVGHLADGLDQLKQRTSRAERIIAVVVVIGAIVLILSIAVGVTLVQLSQLIDREAKTRQKALCPFYSLVLGNYNPNSRPAGPDREAYNRNFDAMRLQYGELDCIEPIVPPPTPR